MTCFINTHNFMKRLFYVVLNLATWHLSPIRQILDYKTSYHMFFHGFSQSFRINAGTIRQSTPRPLNLSLMWQTCHVIRKYEWWFNDDDDDDDDNKTITTTQKHNIMNSVVTHFSKLTYKCTII